ncbi:MAG: Gfo/Idh/MocA family oxidoreductase [Ruminococcaceae bacterium]|nr:Gfo/Idh/MocA family oxidoreductase [Oscillospiraceae bacterium]
MEKINVAVIGYGGMGGWHTRHLLESDVATLCGIYDIKEERRQLARENGIYAYDSLEALLGDEKIELVTIAIPNDQHKEMSIKAMAAGKHVICEKPVTLSAKDLQEIFDAADKYGRLFTTHQNRRWDCDYLMMKEAYASGKLGNVFGVESRYQGSRGIPGDWRGQKKYGGGMLLDWGVHLIDQMLGIVYDRRIESLYCKFDHITNDEVDDGFKLDLYFEGGLTARIEVGTSHFVALPRFYMTGTGGSAVVADWRDACKLVTCDQWFEKDVKPVVTSAGLTKTMAPRDEKTTTESYIERPVSDVHDFYRNYCKAIRGEAEMIVTHAQLMRVMKVMEAAFKSDELGMPVKLEDTIC